MDCDRELHKLRSRVAYLEDVYRFTLEALEMAATLGDFQRSLEGFVSEQSILQDALSRMKQVMEFRALAIFRIDEQTADFYQSCCEPPEFAAYFDREVDDNVERGTFAQALEMQKPLFAKALQPSQRNRPLLLHTVATTSRIRGMLVALPAKTLRHIPDSSLRLISLILLNMANCLESRELYSLVRGTNKELESQVRDVARQKAFYRQLFDNSPTPMVLLGTSGEIREVNAGFELLFGHAAEEAVGCRLAELVATQESEELLHGFFDRFSEGKNVSREITLRHKGGAPFPVQFLGFPVLHDGHVEAVHCSFQDLTARKAFEQQLSYQAFHDALTGLPNRALFMERLERAFKRAKRLEHHRFAVLLLDLDRFKSINDSMGHLFGDELLRRLAERFSLCIRGTDTVARLGGDEFALLLEDFSHAAEVVRVAKRMIASFDQPFVVRDQPVYTGASIGIVVKTAGYENVDDILRDADMALYKAKDLGGGCFKIFSRVIHREAAHCMNLEAELRRAMALEEFCLHYQPVVDVLSGRVVGFEALLRWRHPTRGCMLPGEFIPLAEATGLIVGIGEWVLRKACAQLKAWRRIQGNGSGPSVSVNLSTRQLCQRTLPGFIEGLLLEYDLDPAHLKLEITESAMMQSVKQTADILRRIKEMDIELLVDDFGKGYSSLSYLHQFPIDYLKIDRSFISGKDSEIANLPIVSTLMALARSMGIRVVAEGVEHEGQLRALLELGCPLAQGNLFSPPLESESARSLLQDPSPWCLVQPDCSSLNECGGPYIEA
jgi:ammonium transporter, Amt family